MIRGEREGITGEKGEGFTGTIIKDIRTITSREWKRGREEGGLW